MENLVIAIGSDHGGFEYKNLISEHLKKKNIEVIDVGTYSKTSCDYPEIARKVTAAITENNAQKGILICGSGIGMSIVANKTKGIRAALWKFLVVILYNGTTFLPFSALPTIVPSF